VRVARACGARREERAALERDLFLWIAVGLVSGLLVTLILRRRDPGGFVVALLLGIAGAVGGGALVLSMLGPALTPLASGACAACGALALVVGYRLVLRLRAP